MKRVAKKSTPIQEFARKVGYAFGRAVATTQELAGNAAAMVNHDEAAAQASPPAIRTPRKLSPRHAAKKKKASSPMTSRTKSKKSVVAKKSSRIKAVQSKSRKRRAASKN